MRELVGGKNTIGGTAAVLKSPIKRLYLFTTHPPPKNKEEEQAYGKTKQRCRRIATAS